MSTNEEDDDGSTAVVVGIKSKGPGNRSSQRDANGQFVPVVGQSPTEIALLKHLEALYKNLNLTLESHSKSTSELLKMQREALQDARLENRKLLKRIADLMQQREAPEAEESEEDAELAATKSAALKKFLEWAPKGLELVEKFAGDKDNDAT